MINWSGHKNPIATCTEIPKWEGVQPDMCSCHICKSNCCLFHPFNQNKNGSLCQACLPPCFGCWLWQAFKEVMWPEVTPNKHKNHNFSNVAKTAVSKHNFFHREKKIYRTCMPLLYPHSNSMQERNCFHRQQAVKFNLDPKQMHTATVNYSTSKMF